MPWPFLGDRVRSTGGAGGLCPPPQTLASARVYCVTLSAKAVEVRAAPPSARQLETRMGYGIIRVAKRTARPSVRGMLRHALRENDVPNAVEGAPRPQVLAGDVTSGAALARLSAALKAAPRVQSNTVQALDVLVTASHADMTAWPKERQDAYFADALDFVAERFGGAENILTATIHRDEMTPHMQLLVMPRDQATGRFQAAKMLGGPSGLRELHDAFYARIGASYGLLRGERGQHIEHVPIRQFYAQLAKADTPLPDYMPVPPAPSTWQRVNGQAQAMDAARTRALEHNKRVRAELLRRAKLAAQVAPAVIARQAARYRQAQHLATVGEKARQEGAAALVEARRHHQAAADREQRAEALHAAAGSIFERKDGARMVAAFTRTMQPELVARLAQINKIELVAGRDLIDQLRRAGKCKNLLEGAKLLCSQVEGIEQGAQALANVQNSELEPEQPRRPRER